MLPEASNRKLPAHLQGKVSLNAIGGPCISHELAARRQTGVVFCGRDLAILERIKAFFATDYYHIWPSTDLVGVEVCAALKNAYALGVGLAVGMMEQAGPDGLANMYNPQAALFGQSCFEMTRLEEILKGEARPLMTLPLLTNLEQRMQFAFGDFRMIGPDLRLAALRARRRSLSMMYSV